MPALTRPHTTVATIATEQVSDALATLGNLPPGTDAAEIRLDYFWTNTPEAEAATDVLLAFLETTPVPLLATLRPQRQGGRWLGPENVRLSLLQAALQAGFTIVDAELDALQQTGVATSLAQHGAFVASQHVVGEMPCRSDGLQWLQAMQDFSAQWDKLALPVGAFNDALRVLEFSRAHAERGGRPALAPMGHASVAMRALLPFTGNRATYGAANAETAAPRQPNLTEIQATWTHWGLDAQDLDHLAATSQPWLAVIGTPIGHSRSPAMHNAALKAAKRSERFAALEVPASASALRLALHVAPRIGIRGLSVTAPHKADAARIASPDPLAKAIGAANCIRFEGTEMLATNTDATAITQLVSPPASGAGRALVLGAGGAARAATQALAGLGWSVQVAARDPQRALGFEAIGGHVIPWDARANLAAQLIVNATPLGTLPDDPSPVSKSLLGKGQQIVEFVYASGPTQLQRDASASGAHVVSGLDILLEQGVAAYKFWLNAAPDRDAMQKALGAKT